MELHNVVVEVEFCIITPKGKKPTPEQMQQELNDQLRERKGWQHISGGRIIATRDA